MIFDIKIDFKKTQIFKSLKANLDTPSWKLQNPPDPSADSVTEAELICELSLLQWLPRGLLFTFLQPSIPFQNQSCRSRRRVGGLPPTSLSNFWQIS